MFYPPLGVRVVLAPQPNKLVQVVRSQDTPIARQVVKVVHDDGHKQVDDEERAEHVERDKVGEGDAGAATLVAGVVRIDVALDLERPVAAVQHNVLPRLAGGRAKEHKYGLRKRLKVVVPMDGRVIVQGYLAEYLKSAVVKRATHRDTKERGVIVSAGAG